MVEQPVAEPTLVCTHTEINDKLARKICKDLGIPFTR